MSENLLKIKNLNKVFKRYGGLFYKEIAKAMPSSGGSRFIKKLQEQLH